MNSVVIVGRDAAFWLATNVMHTALAPAGVTVIAVELPSQLGAADVYTTLPPLEALHNQLRIDEAALLRATRGSFSLGQNFTDTVGMTPAFFHAHGSYGAPIDNHDFFPFWLKARDFGLGVALEDFSLTAAAAKHGRMVLPDDATEVYGRTDYAYHLPGLGYVRALRTLAAEQGVAIHPADAVAASLDPETGDILALELGEGRRVEGQFFVDATGGEGLLIGQALGVPRESWRENFPADRVMTARGPGFASIPAYAEVRAWTKGWVGLYPSQAETHVAQVYSSALCGDDEALQAAATVSGVRLSEVSVTVSDPGRRAVAWERNCVAIGEAACTFDPVHGVDLQAVQLGLVHLLSLFPAAGSFSAERVEYNRISRELFERIRDFQSAYYGLSRYGASAFWTQARQAKAAPELLHKIKTFQARGEVAPYENETFLPDSWRALFVGCGLTPESWNPMIERTPPEVMKGEFRRILGFIKDQVLKQPSHDLYLESFCRRDDARDAWNGGPLHG
ncbi:tryptophan 7-halogenase [Caulobacter sp. DWR1-3-2b1]|uniref:tryptophan 7-halogenase n=1 Tax=Caulobacter sp. DWR1-3-2b1 TaxID=2804670 RepID=UPI003CF893A1